MGESKEERKGLADVPLTTKENKGERSPDVDWSLVSNEPYKPTRNDVRSAWPDTFWGVFNTQTLTLQTTFVDEVPDPDDDDGKKTLSPEDQARRHLDRLDAVTPPYNMLELVEINVIDTRDDEAKTATPRKRSAVKT